MPHIITKPVVGVIASSDIEDIDIERYFKPTTAACFYNGAENIVDLRLEIWAKKHNIEFVPYPANYKIFGDKAKTMRDKDIIEASDIVFFFWSGTKDNIPGYARYCNFLHRKYFIHKIT